MDPLQSLIQELERGKESAHHIRTLLHQLQGSHGGDHHHHHQYHSHHYRLFDDHSLVLLTAFDAALSMLRSCDFGKVYRTDLNDSPNHCKSEEESRENAAAAATTTRDRRGCYKRRTIGQEQTVDTPTLIDDGFAWRKYGQKIILNAKNPRNYYRCTHKHDQGCQATKQVQKISENPTKYRIIYRGQHTCNNLLKNPTIFLDTPEEYNSSFFLSFGLNTAKQALNPFIFSSSSTSSSSSAFPSASMVKQEMPSGPSDTHHGTHNQYSPSSDLTTTGLTSSDRGDVFSSAEVYSSTAGPRGMEVDYSCMMADPIDLDDVLQGLLCE